MSIPETVDEERAEWELPTESAADYECNSPVSEQATAEGDELLRDIAARRVIPNATRQDTDGDPIVWSDQYNCNCQRSRPTPRLALPHQPEGKGWIDWGGDTSAYSPQDAPQGNRGTI